MNYFVLYTIYVLILSFLMGVSTWKLFKKMGYNPLFAFIPFYNYYIILKETNHSKWWSALSYLPIVGPIMMSVFHLFLMNKFGKNSTMDKILTVFLPFIYMAYINYGQNVEVEKEEAFLLPGEEEVKKKDSFLGSVTFAVVFATIIHVFVTQPFGIPTGSMERTLLVGDFLFVNKLNYGFRMPMRPVAIPFLQGTIFDTGEKGNPKDDPKSYVDAVKLPYYRLPGWEKPVRNDIVVFNYPQDSVHTAIDRKDPYVKRCVAVAGDILEMRNGRLFVNNEPEKRMKDAEVQYDYYLEASSDIDVNQLFEKYGYLSINSSRFSVDPATIYAKYNMSPENRIYKIQMTEKIANELKELPQFVSLHEDIKDKDVADITYFDQNKQRVYLPYSIFPENRNWNIDWYGPIQIPKKGDVLTLNQDNLPLYKTLISDYEGNTLENKNGKFVINGEETNQYTVKYDYYFMMGDNRDGSLDARYFGFVPETHIVGKPMFTWLSLEGFFNDSNSDFQANGKRIRWDRMFKATNTGDPNKTSYWWLAVLILVLFFGWDFFVKLFKKNKED